MKSKKFRIVFLLCVFFLLGLLGMTQDVQASDSEGNFVIVLDPGHGGGDSGALGGSLREDQINFKIAYYAKQELEKYQDVKVYLTRYNNCPSISERVEIAKKYNADLLVSLHINSGSENSRGAAVWVTQDKTKVQYYKKAAEVGNKILKQLSALGLENDGVFTRCTTTNQRYSSGVLKDYYGIIRFAQNIEMRSILVEHCFISNAEDREFINSDEKIKKLALADVKGIVNAYKLTKKTENQITLKSIKLDKTELNIEKTNDDVATYFLPVTYNPSNASNKVINWYTSNSSCVDVSEGMLYAKAEGEALITAISENNQRLAECKVKVTKPQNPLKGIKLKQTSMNMNINDKKTIYAVYNPENADDKVLYWSSSNENVATVSEGVVTAKSAGTAIITATSRAGGRTAACKLTVAKDGQILLEKISLKTTSLKMKKGETQTIYAVYSPDNATDKVLYWSSSNENVATVSEGVVKAKQNGTTVITAKSKDGGKTATCKVEVGDGTTSLQSISLKTASMNMKKGESKIIYAVYNPSDVKDKVLYWSSSDESVATVYEGTVTAKKNGTATITAKSRDGGKTATCKVTVGDGKVSLQSISLKTTSMSLKKGESKIIYAIYNPSDAPDKVLYWSSSNESVATVYEGNVVAKQNGTATITAKSRDGGKTATCKVTVGDGQTSLQSISLKTTSLKMKKGEQKIVYAVYNPSDAPDKVLYWSSSNNDVVTVSEGVVTAKNGGTATITAKSRDGGKTATCKVEVTVPLQSISLKTTSLTMKKGEQKIVYAVYNPSNATDKVLYWSSSNENVASVYEGNVVAKQSGTATITATSRDGNKKASCTIEVK